MAITTQYIVTHNGKEKLVTTDKKEADQYDKMLDVADNMSTFIRQLCPNLDIQDAALEEVTIKLSQNKVALQNILRGKPAPESE
jgi:dsDNA-binding SOS-regulon protein